MTILCPLPKFRATKTSDGTALSGGKLFTYAAGTTTKLATFTDQGGGTTNTNPVVLDTRGEADVWLGSGTAYKLVLAPSTDSDPPTNAIWTEDNIVINDGALNWAIAGGTADALTLSVGPSGAAPVDGQIVSFRATAANTTTTPTLALNGTTARTFTKMGGTALSAGDIGGNLAEHLARYNFANTRWELLNPSSPSGTWTASDGSGAGLAFTSVSCGYTRNGNLVTVYGRLTYPVTASGSNATIGGLPFTVANQTYAQNGGIAVALGGSVGMFVAPVKATTTAVLLLATTGANVANSGLTTLPVFFNFSYPIA